MLQLYRSVLSPRSWSLQPCINESTKPGALWKRLTFVFCRAAFSPGSSLGWKSHERALNVAEEPLCLCCEHTKRVAVSWDVNTWRNHKVCPSVCLLFLQLLEAVSSESASLEDTVLCHVRSPRPKTKQKTSNKPTTKPKPTLPDL